ncbi:glycosyltransferase family 2 protein [uncultured Sneathiella sp.]|uniref:glycosyltransferase family 2 protein n=1 Tax=uncultured Sneathiella sp. TaxID=879315 RepID=UPI0030EC3F7A|tara:strand:+ start:21169 stop:22134 length:966 start_codon:yes stop_codon:yes gene_type:complete
MTKESSVENPTVSIIVISYNTRDLTLDCIRSVFEQAKDVTFEVIVLDNASTDGSAEAIAAEFPDINLIASKENVGFANGNNLAAKQATGEYILLLNPDTVVLDHAIDNIVQFANAHPKAAVWGGRTLFGDRSLNATSCWRRMTVWSLFCYVTGLSGIFPSSGLFNAEGYGGWKRDTVREIDIVTGCFLLMKRNLWEELGGFDRRFFMYGEDADLCLRAKKRGGRPMITPEATIVHYGGQSEKVVADKMIRLLTAKVTLMQQHWNPVAKVFGYILFYCLPLSKILTHWLYSTLLRKKDRKTNADTWKEIWTRRGEWLAGFSA